MSDSIIITQNAGKGSDTTQIGVQNNYYPIKPNHYEYDIEDRKKKIRDSSVFPWFHSDLSYSEAYPELFILPRMKAKSGTLKFEGLESMVNKNLAITGVAGAGKSTLLRYFFAFLEHIGYKCIYLSARDIEYQDPFDFMEFRRAIRLSDDLKVLFCIDDIDETYDQVDRIGRYRDLITRINNSTNCTFWLGCRSDYYDKTGYSTQYGQIRLELCSWEKEQYEPFIATYAHIVGIPQIPSNLEKLTGMDPNITQMKSNPFQLALLAFLAEESEDKPIKGVYDLYERFLNQWFKHEQDHGRCRNSPNEMLLSLRKAAGKIYYGKEFQFDEMAMNNTGISELLVIDREDLTGIPIAKSFYHRSLAAFLLAHRVISAMMSGEPERLREVLPYKLKDDVTNFIGNKYSYLNREEKETIKDTIIHMYHETPATDANLIVREQAIYFITRLDVDVTDFLEGILHQNPKNMIMRLTLAYGCVLSDSITLRKYALDYAKSLYADSEDAVTNRAWTVIYFGDVLDEDPYTYRDQKKGSWKNARQARIKRFTSENPRLKDYRFRLFDIPLFYSFLKNRNWDELSENELRILEDVDFPENVFYDEERAFLNKVKNELVSDYRVQMKKR